MVGQLDND